MRKPATHLPQGTGRQRAATESTDLQRERILQAATTLFATQGYANTTIAQIVRALGVTKPFVYYYFRDKQEIFETLSWRPTVDCFTTMDFDPADKRPAREKVTEGIERLVRVTIAHHPCAVFPYREPQVYRPEYLAAQRKLARQVDGVSSWNCIGHDRLRDETASDENDYPDRPGHLRNQRFVGHIKNRVVPPGQRPAAGD